MRWRAALAFTLVACLGWPTFVSAQIPCVLSFFSQLPPNTLFSAGPNVVAAAQQYPDLVTAIFAARDAWNVTDAAGRIGNWSGIVTSSDCPAGQPNFQIGAFNFQTTFCPTVEAYEQAFPGTKNLIAFVDYYSAAALATVGVNCPQCGTKSIMINTAYPFSFNPGPGEWDVQSIIAHEFGHMLGLAHMTGGTCRDITPPRCSEDFNRNTMAFRIYDGETCERDLSLFYDVVNANAVY